MLGFYDYTVVLTYLSLALGVTGIALCKMDHPFIACVLLLLCGLCDAFDGRVARTKKNRTCEECSFGIQIDSMCDLISFGVLPAAICMQIWSATHPRAWWLWVLVTLACVFYVLAGVIRLSYFNVTEEIRQSQTKEGRHTYQGLPITMASLTLPEIYLLRYAVPELAFRYIFAAALVILGVCFVSPFQIHKPKGKSILWLVLVGVVICAVMVAIMIARGGVR